MLNLFAHSVLTKTDKQNTIDVVFKNGKRATFTKLFLKEHMEDPETKMIVDNADGEIIYIS